MKKALISLTLMLGLFSVTVPIIEPVAFSANNHGWGTRT